MAARPSADPRFLAEAAEFLLMVEPTDVRDARQALAWAERAAGASGRKQFAAVRALGLALRDNGRVDEAIATLREALFLPDGATSWSTSEHLAKLMSKHRPPQEVEGFLLEFLIAREPSRRPSPSSSAATRH